MDKSFCRTCSEELVQSTLASTTDFTGEQLTQPLIPVKFLIFRCVNEDLNEGACDKCLHPTLPGDTEELSAIHTPATRCPGGKDDAISAVRVFFWASWREAAIVVFGYHEHKLCNILFIFSILICLLQGYSILFVHFKTTRVEFEY